MLNTGVMFSSKTGKWDTPQWLIDDLSPLFHWDLDVCASRPNVCERFNSEEYPDRYEWKGLCWMNPPYGREIGGWVSRSFSRVAATWAFGDCSFVCLLPARTDTAWWQDHVHDTSQVVFIRGRLAFGDDQYWLKYWEDKGMPAFNSRGELKRNAAPFPSAFFVFGDINDAQRAKLSSYGWSIPQGVME